MARRTKFSTPSARRLRDLQLQQSDHKRPHYRVALPKIRNGELRGWIAYTPWTKDRARAEHWLADRRTALQNGMQPRPYMPRKRRKGKGGPSHDNVIRGAALLGPGQMRVVPGGLPGLGKRR